MSTEDTPKPVAVMIHNKDIPFLKPWPTRVNSEAHELSLGRAHCEVTPLFDQAAIDEAVAAAVAKERERCAKVAEDEDVAPTDDAIGVQQCMAASIRRA